MQDTHTYTNMHSLRSRYKYTFCGGIANNNTHTHTHNLIDTNCLTEHVVNIDWQITHNTHHWNIYGLLQERKKTTDSLSETRWGTQSLWKNKSDSLSEKDTSTQLQPYKFWDTVYLRQKKTNLASHSFEHKKWKLLSYRKTKVMIASLFMNTWITYSINKHPSVSKPCLKHTPDTHCQNWQFQFPLGQC